MPAEIHYLVSTWYEQNARDLPWRADQRTAWGVLVSEVMLQQTPVVRVLPAWNAWMDRWPGPRDLAAAEPADVIRAWDRLGYPRRALRLRDAAIAITHNHDGQVPDAYTELIALPGIGDYTAAAVLTFAFRQRAVVLDTNVRRVLARAFDGSENMRSASPTKPERALAESLLPAERSDAARWSIGLMELGALHCRPAPDCSPCPLSAQCRWKALGYPPDPQPKRTAQKFEGTDRQVRGKIMAVLRNTDSPVPQSVIDLTWPDPLQRARALDSLVADGLVEPLETSTYRLPAR